MINPLEQLAEQRAMVLIDSATLLNYLRIDRESTFMEGLREGKRLAEAAQRATIEEPLTKREAAEALGFSEGTIDNMRRRGDLESYEYGGQVRIEKEEVRRFKRTHKSLYEQSYKPKKRLQK